MGVAAILGGALVLGSPPATPSPAGPAQTEPAPPRGPASARARPRRFSVGLLGVGMQAPALQSGAFRLDSRFVGPSTSLAGLGLLGRWSPETWLALDVSVYSGSGRFRTRDDALQISRDHLFSDVGAVLFFARGKVGALGVDGGVGGVFNRVLHEDSGGRSQQTWGAFTARTGLDVQFLTRRVLFTFALRLHGMVANRSGARSSGPLFSADTPAPLPALSTWVVGTVGVAYRF